MAHIPSLVGITTHDHDFRRLGKSSLGLGNANALNAKPPKSFVLGGIFPKGLGSKCLSTMKIGRKGFLYRGFM